MADKEECDKTVSSEAVSNVFNNDGSFLERFKQMQKEKVETDKKPSTVKLPPLLRPGKKIIPKRKPIFLQQTKTVKDEENPPDLKKSKDEGTSTHQVPVNTSPSSSTSLVTNAETTPTPKRKRKSRWGEVSSKEDQQLAVATTSFSQPTAQLSQEQHKQILEQQEMNKLVQQVQNAAYQRKGARKGLEHAETVAMESWEREHLQRTQEMEKTQTTAGDLTESGKGKHFIGDFLPPEELEKFMEKVKAIKEGRNPDLSDYAEHKIADDNVGYQLLQKAGWTEGVGLGKEQEGITTPINKGKQTFDQGGLGTNTVGDVMQEDDQFDVYRKRMMLAYRFRPNPLNNPRRPYY